MLVFYWRLALVPGGFAYVSRHLSFSLLVTFLNTLVTSGKPGEEITKSSFIVPDNPHRQPLFEDYAIHGQLWSNQYFPSDWFDSALSDYDERYMETTSTSHLRAQRVLWLAVRLACAGPLGDKHQKQQLPWLQFDANKGFFSANSVSNVA